MVNLKEVFDVIKGFYSHNSLGGIIDLKPYDDGRGNFSLNYKGREITLSCGYSPSAKNHLYFRITPREDGELDRLYALLESSSPNDKDFRHYARKEEIRKNLGDVVIEWEFMRFHKKPNELASFIKGHLLSRFFRIFESR